MTACVCVCVCLSAKENVVRSFRLQNDYRVKGIAVLTSQRVAAHDIEKCVLLADTGVPPWFSHEPTNPSAHSQFGHKHNRCLDRPLLSPRYASRCKSTHIHLKGILIA